jgi:hypothetical protein
VTDDEIEKLERDAADYERTKALGGVGDTEEMWRLLDASPWMVAEVKRLRAVVDAFAGEVEAAERHFERPRGGMQVPFHGDFSSVEQLPGVRSRLRWWARRMRSALEGK